MKLVDQVRVISQEEVRSSIRSTQWTVHSADEFCAELMGGGSGLLEIRSNS
jgi:hypothetical protein